MTHSINTYWILLNTFVQNSLKKEGMKVVSYLSPFNLSPSRLIYHWLLKPKINLLPFLQLCRHHINSVAAFIQISQKTTALSLDMCWPSICQQNRFFYCPVMLFTRPEIFIVTQWTSYQHQWAKWTVVWPQIKKNHIRKLWRWV